MLHIPYKLYFFSFLFMGMHTAVEAGQQWNTKTKAPTEALGNPSPNLSSVARSVKTNLPESNQKPRLSLLLGYELPFADKAINKDLPLKKRLNAGIGFSKDLKSAGWSLRGEAWYSQIQIPDITLYSYYRSDLDGSRVFHSDSLSVYRLSGFTIGASLARKLPLGFSVQLGVQGGYYPWSNWGKSVESYYSQYAGDGPGGAGKSIALLEAKQPLISSISRFQCAPKLALEKTFFDRVIVGAALTQNLIDLTPQHKSSKVLVQDKRWNIQRNWLLYAGYRF